MITRRGFIGSILALHSAPAIVRADSLMRVVIPTTQEITLITTSGNQILATDMISREALRIMSTNMKLESVYKGFYQDDAKGGDRLIIRKPALYERR